MVAGMQAWAEPAWLGARVRTGPAVGKLPYPDGAFDVVFTAEVLVHVRPEDLASILAELVRVARWQVIHFETSADYQLKVNAHGGCWYHDLCGAYGEIGYLCETLPAGYRVHQPYRVVLDASRPLPEASQILPMLLRRLETDIQGTLDDWSGVGQRMQRLASDGPQACAAAADLQSDPVVLAGKYCDLISARIDAEGEAKAHAEQAQAALLTELAAERSRHAALRQDLAAERDRRSILESESNQVQADLARLESSLGQRMLRRLRRMPGFPLLRSALQAALAVRAKCDFAFDFRRMWRGQRSR
jgi:hypothetical protein